MKKILALVLALMLCMSAAAFAAAPSPEETGGIAEIEIGETEIEWLLVAGVYFQPVVMEPADAAGLSVDEASIHLEADIHALEAKCGFGVDDWIPYMTVEYAVLDENGEEVVTGTFMPMSASDGPHYGANVKMPEEAAEYTLRLTIHSPAENQYLLHVDKETGVWNDATDTLDQWWEEPLVVEFAWEYAPLAY